MRCHHTYVEGLGKVFIPGCMSAAAIGPQSCVCYSKIARCHPHKTELEELREENKQLHRIIRNLTKRNILPLPNDNPRT